MDKPKNAKWYVYTLADPTDGEVFYVGKGTGGRIHQHEKDAANPKAVCSKKLNKIKDIRSQGLEVQKAVCAEFWDEQAAYDHETDLIEKIGLANLTNVLPGGQKAWTNRRDERATRKLAEPKPLHVWLDSGAPQMRTLYQRFSEWLRAGMHENGMKVKVSASNPAFRINAMVTEAVYNEMLPMMWGRIKADAKAREVFCRRIQPFGIQVV